MQLTLYSYCTRYNANMSTVFICLILVTLVNGYATYSVTVKLDNICTNIYDHGHPSSLTQLVMSVFAYSGEKRDVLYYSSDLHSAYDNSPVHFFTPDSTASSFELDDLSVSDNLIFTLYAAVMVGQKTEQTTSRICPDSPSVFDFVVDPWTMFKGKGSTISDNIAVNISTMICSDSPYAHLTSTCDQHSKFKSDSINLNLFFVCPESCSDLVTTTTIPSTTTTAQPTTTSTSMNVTDSTNHKSNWTGYIALAVVEVIELVIIGIAIFICHRRYSQMKANIQPDMNIVEELPKTEKGRNTNDETIYTYPTGFEDLSYEDTSTHLDSLVPPIKAKPFPTGGSNERIGGLTTITNHAPIANCSCISGFQEASNARRKVAPRNIISLNTWNFAQVFPELFKPFGVDKSGEPSSPFVYANTHNLQSCFMKK